MILLFQASWISSLVVSVLRMMQAYDNVKVPDKTMEQDISDSFKAISTSLHFNTLLDHNVYVNVLQYFSRLVTTHTHIVVA